MDNYAFIELIIVFGGGGGEGERRRVHYWGT